MVGRLVNNELEIMQKKTIMFKFEILFRHFSGQNDSNINSKEEPMCWLGFVYENLPKLKQECYLL
jgi:hypothetical protein